MFLNSQKPSLAYNVRELAKLPLLNNLTLTNISFLYCLIQLKYLEKKLYHGNLGEARQRRSETANSLLYAGLGVLKPTPQPLTTSI